MPPADCPIRAVVQEARPGWAVLWDLSGMKHMVLPETRGKFGQNQNRKKKGEGFRFYISTQAKVWVLETVGSCRSLSGTPVAGCVHRQCLLTLHTTYQYLWGTGFALGSKKWWTPSPLCCAWLLKRWGGEADERTRFRNGAGVPGIVLSTLHIPTHSILTITPWE